mmetsp:Transcript_18075/g.43199  ORF Transcript_18075/g.43199 Transcript_18075/m.43199 type:complete len:209 (+) Transcript_18075:1295-1921(+)
MFLRQEDHADAVLAGRRQLDALAGHFLAVVLVRDLDQDAGAVTHQFVGADRATVVQVLEDLQALLDDVVRLVTLDVGDKSQPTGVLLIRGPVQAALGKLLNLGLNLRGVAHVALLEHNKPGAYCSAARATTRLNGVSSYYLDFSFRGLCKWGHINRPPGRLRRGPQADRWPACVAGRVAAEPPRPHGSAQAAVGTPALPTACRAGPLP